MHLKRRDPILISLLLLMMLILLLCIIVPAAIADPGGADTTISAMRDTGWGGT